MMKNVLKAQLMLLLGYIGHWKSSWVLCIVGYSILFCTENCMLLLFWSINQSQNPMLGHQVV